MREMWVLLFVLLFAVEAKTVDVSTPENVNGGYIAAVAVLSVTLVGLVAGAAFLAHTNARMLSQLDTRATPTPNDISSMVHRHGDAFGDDEEELEEK